jgi:hypothetical protein
MDMKGYSWSKYFIPPFHNDEICVDTIWDSAGNRTTTSSSEAAFKGTADAHFRALAAAMNAKMNGTELPAKMSFGHPVYEGTQCDAVVKFKADGKEIELDVRGWGFLTGRKRLSPNAAAAIQDDFGNFIVDCMNSINSDAEA